MAEVVIMEASIDPNPIKVKGSYKISVAVVDKVHGIMDTEGRYLLTTDGKVIDRDG